MDTETGLYYYRHRWYVAAETNLSPYVGNRPVGFLDPRGLDRLDDYANWFNGVVGSGYSTGFGESVIHPVITTVISNDRLADASATELTVGTTLVSIPIAIGIVGDGEAILGVGTLGGSGGLLSTVVVEEHVAGVVFSQTTLGEVVAGGVVTVPYLIGSGFVTVAVAYPMQTMWWADNIYDAIEPGPPSRPLGMAFEIIGEISESECAWGE